jgi:hypothetical protein
MICFFGRVAKDRSATCTVDWRREVQLHRNREAICTQPAIPPKSTPKERFHYKGRKANQATIRKCQRRMFSVGLRVTWGKGKL